MFDSCREEGWTIADFCILHEFKGISVLQRACICKACAEFYLTEGPGGKSERRANGWGEGECCGIWEIALSAPRKGLCLGLGDPKTLGNRYLSKTPQNT